MLDKIWYPTNKLFIGGKWVAPVDGEELTLENPSTGEGLTTIARGKAADVDARR